jgi:hypothetical protein
MRRAGNLWGVLMGAAKELEPKLRIISGDSAVAERIINDLIDSYVPIVWNIQPGPAGAIVTCVLLHGREIRKAQLAQANQQMIHGIRGS